jgi:hypothetical protein
MAKKLRKAEARRAARRNACLTMRENARKSNPGMPVELAFKMPGSMKR